MNVQKPTKVEYICTWCGQKTVMFISNGRPFPGRCPKKPKDSEGKMKPHTWTISRKF